MGTALEYSVSGSNPIGFCFARLQRILARGVCAYVAVFWGIRVALQAIFDVKEHLTAWWLKTGYVLLTLLFILFTVIYSWAALHRQS